jgi:hypothetical protein
LDPFAAGALFVAGMDRTGVSAAPARSLDPYTDGGQIDKHDPFTDGTHTVAGMDTSGVSGMPGRSFDPYRDDGRA